MNNWKSYNTYWTWETSFAEKNILRENIYKFQTKAALAGFVSERQKCPCRETAYIIITINVDLLLFSLLNIVIFSYSVTVSIPFCLSGFIAFLVWNIKTKTHQTYVIHFIIRNRPYLIRSFTLAYTWYFWYLFKSTSLFYQATSKSSKFELITKSFTLRPLLYHLKNVYYTVRQKIPVQRNVRQRMFLISVE